MTNRILVIGDETAADQVGGNLRLEGFDVETAPGAEAGASMAFEGGFLLIICDDAPPDIDGFEICRSLKSNRRTAGVPVILISDAARLESNAIELESIVDEFMTKPYRLTELLARVNLSIKRMGASPTDPLTGLPGNIAADDRLRDVVRSGAPFTLMLIAVKGLRPFHETYDDERFEQVIHFTAETIKEVIRKEGGRRDHTAYLGNGTFSVITVPERAATLARSITRLFDGGIRSFYSVSDADRGCLTTFNRQGSMLDNPIMTVSIGLASNTNPEVQSHWGAAEIARELLEYAMSFPESKYCEDRRAKNR
ncbi:MAG: response regulator [Actinobacteria bacterium]|nr:response regulator [Actinomycetota bacterium]MCG2795832.1 response regulator [Actinomycetes bacterium]